MQGQVTRSGQVTIPYKNFTIAPQLQFLRESYETFGIWSGHRYLQNVLKLQNPLKLRALIHQEQEGTYKMYISDFLYRWP